MESDPPKTDHDSIDLDKRPEPGWRTEPPVLRRIDWLAVAPWTLIFRAPAVAASPTILVCVALVGILPGLTPPGGVASVALNPDEIATIAFANAAWVPGYPYGLISAGADLWEPLATMVPSLGAAAVLLTILLTGIGRLCAVRLTVTGASGARQDLYFGLRRGHRTVAATLLLLLPGLLTLAAGMGGAFLFDTHHDSDTGSMAADLVHAIGLVAGLLLSVALAASPLTLAAVVVDGADPFDAASRAIAYAVQKPLTLVWAVACLFGLVFASGLILETFLAVANATGEWLIGQERNGSALAVSNYAISVVRSYYLAAWLVGLIAIYLIMRQRVDGQPLDEIAPWKGDQPQ